MRNKIINNYTISYTMLSSCYNIPNSFWPIIAGIINDIYGYRITMLIFMFNSLIG